MNRWTVTESDPKNGESVGAFVGRVAAGGPTERSPRESLRETGAGVRVPTGASPSGAQGEAQR